MKNYCYIDGQNLHLGTAGTAPAWHIDLHKFRIYPREGDGDYKMLIDYLIEEAKLEKILFPNKKFRSSLYKEIGAPYFAYLDDKDVKKKISRRKLKQN